MAPVSHSCPASGIADAPTRRSHSLVHDYKYEMAICLILSNSVNSQTRYHNFGALQWRNSTAFYSLFD